MIISYIFSCFTFELDFCFKIITFFVWKYHKLPANGTPSLLLWSMWKADAMKNDPRKGNKWLNTSSWNKVKVIWMNAEKGSNLNAETERERAYFTSSSGKKSGINTILLNITDARCKTIERIIWMENVYWMMWWHTICIHNRIDLMWYVVPILEHSGFSSVNTIFMNTRQAVTLATSKHIYSPTHARTPKHA